MNNELLSLNIKQAKSLISKQEYYEAEKTLELLANIDPDRRVLMLYLTVLVKLQKWESAQKTIDQLDVYGVNPNEYLSHKMLVLLKTGYPHEVITLNAQLRNTSKKDVERLTIYTIVAEAYFTVRNYNECSKYINKGLRIDKNNEQLLRIYFALLENKISAARTVNDERSKSNEEQFKLAEQKVKAFLDSCKAGEFEKGLLQIEEIQISPTHHQVAQYWLNSARLVQIGVFKNYFSRYLRKTKTQKSSKTIQILIGYLITAIIARLVIKQDISIIFKIAALICPLLFTLYIFFKAIVFAIMRKKLRKHFPNELAYMPKSSFSIAIPTPMLYIIATTYIIALTPKVSMMVILIFALLMLAAYRVRPQLKKVRESI